MTLLPTWFEVIHYLALENKCFCEWYVFMMIKHTAHLCTCEVFQQCLKDLKLQPGVSEIYLPVVSYERTCVIHTSSCMGVKETMCKKVWNGIFKVFLVIWHKEKPCTESHWGHSGTYFKTTQVTFDSELNFYSGSREGLSVWWCICTVKGHLFSNAEENFCQCWATVSSQKIRTRVAAQRTQSGVSDRGFQSTKRLLFRLLHTQGALKSV